MAEQATTTQNATATTEATTQTTATPVETTSGKLIGEGKTFKDAEGLAKAYLDLQAAFTKQSQEAKAKAETPKVETPEPAKVQANSTEAKASESQPGADKLFASLLEEFQANNGKITEQSIDIVSRTLGMPKAQANKLVKFYEQEYKAGLADLQSKIDGAGVSMKIEEVLAEANKHYSAEQLAQIQASIDAGFGSVIVEVAQTIAKAKKPAAQVGQVTTEVGGGFASAEEIHKATSHHNFTTDKSYRQRVEARIAATSQSVVEEWSNWAKRR